MRGNRDRETPHDYNRIAVTLPHGRLYFCLQQCSRTCGEGSRYRKVLCVDKDEGGEVHSVLCDMSRRPVDRESCSLQPCEYVWITGEWSEVLSWGFCVTAFRPAMA